MAPRVLVTGASSGIGEATVERLIEHGWEVVATARRQEDLDRLADWGATPVELDLRDSDSIQRAAQEILTLGPLDGVVHNAGAGVPGAVEDLGPEAWHHQFEVNVFGAVELTRALLPAVRRTQGRFIFISSYTALVTLPLYGAYAASKKAIEAAADALRMELAPERIKVIIIESGPATTPFHDRAEARRETYIDEDRTRHQGQYEKMDQTLTEQVTGKVPPEAVASAVHKALTRPWVPQRMHVGKVAWIGTLLVRVLPGKLRDRAIRWWLGLS